MPLWLFWLLPACETGLWYSTVRLFRRRNGNNVRAILIHGITRPTTVPFVDDRLRKAAGPSTKSQAFVTSWITRGVRWAVNTQAFEYTILLGVRHRWPGKGQLLDSKIRLCL